MSLPPSVIKCTKCDFSYNEIPRGIILKYILSANEFLTGYAAYGWCYSCNGIQDIEKLSTIQECQAELADLRAQIKGLESEITGLKSNFLGRTLNKSKINDLQNELAETKQEFAETEKKLKWLGSRRSGARCLNCGSEQTARLRFSASVNGQDIAEGFSHKCGGRLYIEELPDGPRFNISPITIVLDKEGNLWGADRKKQNRQNPQIQSPEIGTESIADAIRQSKDEYIIYLRTDVPNVYDFVLNQLQGMHDEQAAIKLIKDYGNLFYDDLMKVVYGQEDNAVIERFKEEYHEDVYIAIKNMLALRPLNRNCAPEQSDTLPVGFRIGEYRIQSLLGRGGFGITYLILDSNLHKPFALKEYFPVALAIRGHHQEITAKDKKHEKTFEKGRDDFLREARILAAFKHQNIVSAVRVVEANNTAYIVMEHEKGRSLQSQIENRHENFSEQEVLSIFLPLLEGLEELHKKGVIHRDIKPDNIFIRENGTPVLIDFGAARNFQATDGLNMSVILTPNYAPFEQFSSDIPQGPYTDIYSLGCVLYYLTTGRVPLPAAERLRGEDIESAESISRGNYSDVFLRAIDLAIHIDYRKRPQTLTDWRKLFDPSGYHYDLLPVVENIQYKTFASYKNWILKQFGMKIILHEAVLFSVILPLIDFEWRLQRNFDLNQIYKIYCHLIDPVRAKDILSADQPEGVQRLLSNDVDIQSLFCERYRQYSASYLIDREQEEWVFKMTAHRFLKNVIAGISLPNPVPDWLVQYGSDLIDDQRGRVKRDLQKLDPRWGART